VSISSRIRKKEISVGTFSATCEAPFFSIDKGIPTVIFGPGSLTQAHVTDENIVLAEVEQASLILIHLGLDLPRK
jgi:acetylornithine deacetylase/succinyl-diaminopimelate desuccinylase-like protein